MIGTTCGIPSDVLYDRAFAQMRAQENLGNIVKILKNVIDWSKNFKEVMTTHCFLWKNT